MIYSAVQGFMEELPISKILPSTVFRRRSPDEVGELADSIERKGLLHPLVVRPKGDNYELISGHRRFEACRTLSWRKVPCHVIDVSDRDAFEIALVENLQRRTLDPLEEAEGYHAYVEKRGWGSVTDLARRIGRSQGYVSQRLLLLRLPKPVRELIEQGDITPSLARELTSLPAEKQEEVAELSAQTQLPSRAVKQLVAALTRQVEPTLYSQFGNSSNLGLLDIERRARYASRALTRGVVSLRIAMARMDEILEDLEDSWFLHDSMLEQRKKLHQIVDELVRLKTIIRNKKKFWEYL